MNNIESNTSKDKSLKTKKLILAGIFAALTAVCSWININLFFTPVPINLALIGPYMAGLLLGSRYGLMSQVIYILLGAIGLPVFAGFTGGLEKLVGPTGGFIAGYAVCCYLRSAVQEAFLRQQGRWNLGKCSADALRPCLLLRSGAYLVYDCNKIIPLGRIPGMHFSFPAGRCR